ncbi:MAG: hypothetical protein K1X66_01050 [Verrucomicrobiae bacterium]|nr:hypothetical protein [Verrucomicrobiae bacterium]
MLPDFLIPKDLAPGDRRVLESDWSGLRLHRVESDADPVFELAYEKLWQEFGHRNEVETRETLARRMRWDPRQSFRGCHLLYQMMVFFWEQAGKKEFMAVRDHTAIVCEKLSAPQVVVHLSHVLVEEKWRRSGVAGWLRTLPLQTARECLKKAGLSERPITLVGEMEAWDETKLDRVIRLKAYAKAGYKMVDPKIDYWQPDFRSSEQIDASYLQPVPLCLMVRRVGRELEQVISGEELRSLIESLYHMYSVEFREKDMEPLWEHIKRLPAAHETVALISPVLENL